MEYLKKAKFWFTLICLLVTPLLFLGIFQFRSSVNVSKKLSNLPKDDRNALEYLFHHINKSGCAYVLFGTKPMGFYDFLEIEQPDCSRYGPVYDYLNLCPRVCLPNVKINRSWEVWEKYKHLFPASNFILLKNRDSNCVTIFMINKHHFLKKIAENIDIFKEVLGAGITPIIILENCLKSNDIIGDVLKHHDGLLGILLGFGRHNALLYSRRTEIERASRKISLNEKPIAPSDGFSTIQEELRYLNEVLTGVNEIGIPDCNPLLFGLPGFMADLSHPETQKLKVEYKKQYKKIIDRYKEGDFLEITLKQFCI